MAAENSEVSPPGLVAVAVTSCLLPTFFLVLKVKEALPEVSVVTLFWAKNLFPSRSMAGLEKTWTVNVVLAVLFSVPLIVVTPRRETLAEVSRGKFCRLLAPVSPGSLAVGPSC
jgi:hypothetical protein